METFLVIVQRKGEHFFVGLNVGKIFNKPHHAHFNGVVNAIKETYAFIQKSFLLNYFQTNFGGSLGAQMYWGP